MQPLQTETNNSSLPFPDPKSNLRKKKKERNFDDGKPIGELGTVDKIEGSSSEEEQEAIREDGQELECQGRDPKQEGSKAHRQDTQGC